jgi:hypothetical protein
MANLELQLLLKLNDQMSRGLKSALQAAEAESKNVANGMAGISKATSSIKATPIERVTSALRAMSGAAKSGMSALEKLQKVGASTLAAGYVLKTATDKPVAFDQKLAIMANTAYGGTVENRIAGRAKLENSINSAVRSGGGTRDEAADTLNSLIGSGAMGEGQKGIDSSMKLLPTIQKVASATGASSQDLAQLVQSLKQQMKMSDDDVKVALSKAIVAGQNGGFELSNMAKWLPQQIALASSAGMTGMRGFETLISANQATRITAGTSDEAGNNLVNLLAKITSNDTANDFKKQHIDLYGSLAAGVASGQTTLDSFIGLVKHISEKDKQYQSLKAKAETASDPEKKALIDSMVSILMAKGIGKTVQDRQALGALLGMIQQNDKYQKVLSGVGNEHGQEIDIGFKPVQGTIGFKETQVGNEKDIAASNTLQAMAGPLGNMLDGVVSLTQAYPKLATATYAVTASLAALAAANFTGGLFGKPGVVGKMLPSTAGVMPFIKNNWGKLGKLGITAEMLLHSDKLNDGEDNMFEKMRKHHDAVQALMSKPASAQSPINITLQVDGKQLASVVNVQNTTQARRH